MHTGARSGSPRQRIRRTAAALALPALMTLSAPCLAASLWTSAGTPPSPRIAAASGGEAVRFALDASRAGEATFEFELHGMPTQARRIHSERFSGGWNWSGEIAGDPAQLLEVTWVGDRLAGRLQTATGLWEIRPLAANESLLVAVDATSFPDELPPRTPPAPQRLDAPAAGDQAPVASNGWRMDVLVTYLAAVASEAGGTANLTANVHNIVYGANQAARRSALSGRFHLVGLLQSPLPDQGDFGDLLDAVTDDPWTAAKRDEYAADLVSLLLPDATHSDLCGLGWMMGDHDTYTYQAYAFQVTNFGCARTNYSWAHEHGHNLGFAHDVENGGDPYHPYAFGWAVDGLFRTIMAYPGACVPSCPRIGMFSTPLLDYLGQPAGVANAADNVRAGNITAPIVAAYRSGNVLFADGFED